MFPVKMSAKVMCCLPMLALDHQKELVCIATSFWSTSKMENSTLTNHVYRTPVAKIVADSLLPNSPKSIIWAIQLLETSIKPNGTIMFRSCTNNWALESTSLKQYRNQYFHSKALKLQSFIESNFILVPEIGHSAELHCEHILLLKIKHFTQNRNTMFFICTNKYWNVAYTRSITSTFNRAKCKYFIRWFTYSRLNTQIDK